MASTCSIRPSCSSARGAGPPGDPEAGGDEARDRQDGGVEGVLERRPSRRCCEQSPGRLRVSSRCRRRRDRAARHPSHHATRSSRARCRPCSPPGQREAVGQPRRAVGRARAAPGARRRRGRGGRAAAARAASGHRQAASSSTSTPPPRVATRRAAGYQPNGDSQLSQLGADVADRAQRVERRPSTAPAMPAQVRAAGRRAGQRQRGQPVATSPIPRPGSRPKASEPADG